MKMKSLGQLRVPKTKAEFSAACAAAPGPVLVEFVAQGCDACTNEAPRVKALVKSVAVTVLKVDVNRLPEVADAFNVTAMPTFFVAPSGAAVTKQRGVEEVAGVVAAKRYLAKRARAS